MASIRQRKVHNRVLILMAHTTRYAFRGQSRLARDAGISKSAISRLVTGQSSPLFITVTRMATALEKVIGKRIDPRELITEDNAYPTRTICQFVGCKGCCYSKVVKQTVEGA